MNLSSKLAVRFSKTALILGMVGTCFGGAPLPQVDLEVGLANPVLEAGRANRTFLKVGLTGFDLPQEGERSPINVALVLDKSGSMEGEKLRRAKEAARLAVSRLNSDDILSIVTYDSVVSVLVPATKVSDKDAILRKIDAIRAKGGTALFGGVSKGAAEIRKFLSEERVNRAILLSDGLANEGPSSPEELADLGASLLKEGISVTTLGLGDSYNEDLMLRLAERSDGNHAYIQEAAQLAGIFDQEFGDILSVVAQSITIKVRCREGVKPLRILGREAEISGNEAVATLNQIYSNQEKYLLLEVEVPPGEDAAESDIAVVEVEYANMATGSDEQLERNVAARFATSAEEVAANANREVNIAAITQIATINNDLAVQKRDAGDIEAATVILTDNKVLLEQGAKEWGSKELQAYGIANNNDLDGLEDDSQWAAKRKGMVAYQAGNRLQQKVELNVVIQEAEAAAEEQAKQKEVPKESK